MQLLVLMLVIFVVFVSINTIYRQYKRRKNESAEFESRFKYERRLGSDKDVKNVADNRRVDYREPLSKKDDYADWGD